MLYMFTIHALLVDDVCGKEDLSATCLRENCGGHLSEEAM